MGTETIDILGFPATTLTREEILHRVNAWIDERNRCHHLMALNPIKVCRAQHETELSRHIHAADLVYPDAYGIAWAMSRFSGKKFHPIPGCDLLLELLQSRQNRTTTVYLVGSRDEVVREAARKLSERFPHVQVLGTHAGYFVSLDDEHSVLQSIVTTMPDAVFVGMGALVQEDWIERIRRACEDRGAVIPLLMGVGGSFDAITGTVRRPPRWMLNLHLEWLFRLLQQPFRAPRMMALPRFAMQVLSKQFLRLGH